jgi:hypothetical protein
LHPDRVNENQGAESTLAFLMALLEIRLLEDAELPFTRHEALATSGNALNARTPLENV